MIKTTLLVVLLAIFVATIQAANPFDTNNRPFVIGGAFKRVEKKSPSSGFACYNTTLGDWTDYRWTDAAVSTSQVSIVQLNNGHTISLMRIGTTNKYGLLYWNLESATVLTTTTTVMEAGSNPVLYLSYDQKKLYVGASFTRVGTNSYLTEVPLKYRIFSFDISTLPTLAAPSDITSSYGLSTTYSLNAPNAVYPVSNGNQLLFAFPGGVNPAAFVVFDPASTSWKEILVTVIRSSSSQYLTMHSGTGELYAKSFDTTSPYASSFWKYDSANSNYFVNVKTLGASTYVTTATEAQAYIASWTVGTGGLYYTVSITNPTFTRFENGMQNIQKVTLTPSPSDPVSLSKTRLTVALDRTSIDTLPISNSISSMYYDENIKQLVVQLTNEGYQVYGPRDSDNTKNKYELTYRLQPVGQLVSYDATTDAFTVPYGGNFATGVSRFSIYPTVSVTCFGISSYFRTWAPNFAVYDQGKDMFVAENLLSGQIDYDWQNNQPATVTAVENSDDSSVVYVGGYFRTISGTVYNSIVSRTKTGLVALGTGLRIHNFDYNTFDNTPGTVKKLVRSKDNKYLFVLGTFNRAGDLWVNGLAYWNIEKKTWNKLEVNAVEGTINDIDFDGRYLYAVGTITRAGKYVVNNAARFDMDSQTWLPMNDGLSAAAPGGMVIDGKFVALVGAGSGVTFWRSLAVWSSNSWKAVEMDSVSNSGCAADKEVCITDTPTTSMTYFKGKIYFLSGSKVYVSDTSMSKATLYARGNLVVSAGTQFYNYPKSNTIGVATPSGNTFVEYNIDTKNIQHTNTRDAYVIADAAVNVFSAAPKNIFSVVALIVTLIATLFF